MTDNERAEAIATIQLRRWIMFASMVITTIASAGATYFAILKNVAVYWPWHKGPPTQLDILGILDANPDIRKLNANAIMNERYFDALAEEPIYARSYQRSQPKPSAKNSPKNSPENGGGQGKIRICGKFPENISGIGENAPRLYLDAAPVEGPLGGGGSCLAIAADRLGAGAPSARGSSDRRQTRAISD